MKTHMLSPQDSASPWSKGRGWANVVTNAEAVTIHAPRPLMTGTASSQFLPERIKNKETDPECPLCLCCLLPRPDPWGSGCGRELLLSWSALARMMDPGLGLRTNTWATADLKLQ